jgi:hypothetical protein
MLSLATNRPAVLCAICIRALDRCNRIRRMQRLPLVNYSPLEVERLCDVSRALLGAKAGIIKIVTEQALAQRGGRQC